MKSVQNIAVDTNAASATDLWLEEMCGGRPRGRRPGRWLGFWDDNRWELTPDALAYEPTEAEREWAAEQELADELEDAQATSVWLERLAQAHRITDLDVQLVTGCAG